VLVRLFSDFFLQVLPGKHPQVEVGCKAASESKHNPQCDKDHIARFTTKLVTYDATGKNAHKVASKKYKLYNTWKYFLSTYQVKPFNCSVLKIKKIN
jgi:hypothetical protein